MPTGCHRRRSRGSTSAARSTSRSWVGTAYVLVTLVSGMLFDEPFGDPEAKNGLYRVERDGSVTLVADLGQWSVDNPPEPAFFVDTGVHFALETYRGGFVVTDGHHNRVLFVDRDGSIRELATFGNVVPTGLETTAGQGLRHPDGPDPTRGGGRQGGRPAREMRSRGRLPAGRACSSTSSGDPVARCTRSHKGSGTASVKAHEPFLTRAGWSSWDVTAS